MPNILLIFFAVFSTLMLVPVATFLGIKLEIVDRPGDRRLHEGVVPRTGGIVLLVIFTSTPFLLFLCPGSEQGAPCFSSIYFAGSIMLIGLLGLYDDLRGAKPLMKILFQISAALLMISSGIVIESVKIPYDGSVSIGYFGYFVTVLWIVGLTNAYNLIDGLDGLACGISFVVAAVAAFIGFMNGNIVAATLAAMVAASCLSFYVFNRHPARVFLGDTGSMLLGFLIAIISIECFKTGDGSVAFFPMVVINGLVIADTTIVFFKRLSHDGSPFAPDTDHVHHRLLTYTGSAKRTLKILLAVAALLGVAGTGLMFGETSASILAILPLFIFFTALLSVPGREIIGVLLSLNTYSNKSRVPGPENKPE